jgi:hypothetical protein
LVFEVTEKFDLHATSAGGNQPPPTVDSSVWFGADRIEGSLERPHITPGIGEEGDVDVDVGGAEVSWRFAAFVTREELGHEPTEHNQVEVMGAQCAEELKERILGELASLR